MHSDRYGDDVIWGTVYYDIYQKVKDQGTLPKLCFGLENHQAREIQPASGQPLRTLGHFGAGCQKTEGLGDMLGVRPLEQT